MQLQPFEFDVRTFMIDKQRRLVSKVEQRLHHQALGDRRAALAIEGMGGDVEDLHRNSPRT